MYSTVLCCFTEDKANHNALSGDIMSLPERPSLSLYDRKGLENSLIFSSISAPYLENICKNAMVIRMTI